MRSVKILTKEYEGVERIKPAIETEINLYHFYRTSKYPNLLWRE